MYVLATRSAGKLRELRMLFARYEMDVTDLVTLGVPETPDEDGIESYDTFEENALAKAAHFHAVTGLAAFADDSGLVVPVLGGAPGVRSRRWGARPGVEGSALDSANNARLLAELRRARAELPAAAEYVCAAAFVSEGRSVVRVGRTAGVIVAEGRGRGGFGYDPYFESAELGVTFGEAPPGAKLSVSHRRRAFEELLDALGVGVRVGGGGRSSLT